MTTTLILYMLARLDQVLVVAEQSGRRGLCVCNHCNMVNSNHRCPFGTLISERIPLAGEEPLLCRPIPGFEVANDDLRKRIRMFRGELVITGVTGD